MAKRKKLEEKVDIFIVDTDIKQMYTKYFAYQLVTRIKSYHTGPIGFGMSFDKTPKQIAIEAAKRRGNDNKGDFPTGI